MNELEYIPIETAWLLTENDIYYVDLMDAEHLSFQGGTFVHPSGHRCEVRDSYPSSQQFKEIHISSC